MKVKKVGASKVAGTSLQGRIYTTYARLVKALGKPNTRGDRYKTDAEWVLQIDGAIVTIYNYKDGKSYLGKKGLPLSRITDWHIGGKSKRVVGLIRSILG